MIGQWIITLEPASEGIHFRLSAANSDAFRDSAEGEPENTRLALLKIGSPHWYPKIHPVVREGKAGSHDADYSCWIAIQPYRLAGWAMEASFA